MSVLGRALKDNRPRPSRLPEDPGRARAVKTSTVIAGAAQRRANYVHLPHRKSILLSWVSVRPSAIGASRNDGGLKFASAPAVATRQDLVLRAIGRVFPASAPNLTARPACGRTRSDPARGVKIDRALMQSAFGMSRRDCAAQIIQPGRTGYALSIIRERDVARESDRHRRPLRWRLAALPASHIVEQAGVGPADSGIRFRPPAARCARVSDSPTSGIGEHVRRGPPRCGSSDRRHAQSHSPDQRRTAHQPGGKPNARFDAGEIGEISQPPAASARSAGDRSWNAASCAATQRGGELHADVDNSNSATIHNRAGQAPKLPLSGLGCRLIATAAIAPVPSTARRRGPRLASEAFAHLRAMFITRRAPRHA